MTPTDTQQGASRDPAPPRFLPCQPIAHLQATCTGRTSPTAADLESFDVDAFLASLPSWRDYCEQPSRDSDRSIRGSAGRRLRDGLSARVSDELLREIASDTFGAVRCSQKYLNAMRVVLGNQAHAEQFGYLLEMNTRTSFATEKVMRTILGQMDQAGVTFKKQAVLGQGRVQAVHCYRRRPANVDPAALLNALYRRTESENSDWCASPTIPAYEVPY
ncbi:hypothetical protein G8A07_17130 [Roseateles sp. DAIF2]|uniref:hypothetical protein n=1 Tax=Roseateles sp. DAIF2 TaxID=2714952 RepID=UPI0018A33580|nr:hypothetical protein [Roseateles sp. DAIF2]QPF74471.1 hypothetical protein G8A07_17130 [Roseateles sp. DAIF2]